MEIGGFAVFMFILALFTGLILLLVVLDGLMTPTTYTVIMFILLIGLTNSCVLF